MGRTHAVPNFTSVLGIALAPWLPRVSLAFYALMPVFFIFPNPITSRFLQGSQSRAHAENAETHLMLASLARPLGTFEHVLWAVDQWTPRHFVVVARIEGRPITAKYLKRALSELSKGIQH